MSSAENLKTYRGNCHCGAFIYEATLPEITSYSECNCSICRKKGYAWLFASEGQLDIVKGSIDELASYTFNNGIFVHRFCPTCGTGVLAQNINNPSAVTTAINARAIQGLDVWSLDIKPFDGKELPPAYKPASYQGPEPAVKFDGGKTLKVDKPLEARDITVDEERIVECNCSICSRGAYIWIYPLVEETVIEGREHLDYRAFNKTVVRKAFCRHCGVHICNELNELTDAEIEALNDAAKAWRDRSKSIRPITLRVLDDFDFKTLKTNRLDGWDIIKPLYVNP
ncbi:glutathione-dependent formaldehyde-activating gfa [Diaporthe amygdali]|uniref:glutathione-dependent formaldehyde-activating gfa n=1 Tax=Phomopsis amygdali TaxID=1214568 RepID=UPI0022FDC75E|nr:glutathione-dependent formaldehyde-activating gfa [Diaporthe amygdali]KAJ0115342.1 glutathione-dependent formaldehyde-activating gfa [Diaporthe amygdali]